MAQFSCGSLIQARSSEFKASMNQSIQSILHSKNNETFKEGTVSTLNNHQFLCDPSQQAYHHSSHWLLVLTGYCFGDGRVLHLLINQYFEIAVTSEPRQVWWYISETEAFGRPRGKK